MLIISDDSNSESTSELISELEKSNSELVSESLWISFSKISYKHSRQKSVEPLSHRRCSH
jgi:hypothetical protein